MADERKSAVVPQASALWMNTDAEVYYRNPGRYIDWMKRSSDIVVQKGVVVERADGWIASMSPGARCLYYIVFGEEHTYVPAGDYVVFGGQQVTKSLNHSGLTNVRTAGGNVYFTVPPGAGNTTWLQLVLDNNTAAELRDVEGIRICRVGDEARATSGQLYTQAYYDLQRYYRPAGSRTMSSTDATWPVTYSPKTPAQLENFTSKRRSYASRGYVPFDVLARFSADLKQDFWFSFPGLRDSLPFRLEAATNRIYLAQDRDHTNVPYVHGWPDGTPIYLGIESAAYGLPDYTLLYTRNGSGDSFQVSMTPRGPILDITLDLAFSYTWVSRWYSQEQHLALYRAIAAQVHRAYRHTGEIWFEVLNEPWNNQFGNNPYYQAVGCHMATGTDKSNYQSRMGNGIAHLSLLAIKAMREFFPAERLRCQMNTQLAWFDHLNREWDYVDPGLVQPGKALREIPRIDCAVATYIAPCKPGTADGNNFTMKDFIDLRVARWTDQQWKDAYLANLPTLKRWLTETRTRLDEKKPGIRLTTYETGQHLWVDAGPSTPEYLAVRDRFLAFLQSRAMAEVIRAQYEQLHLAFGIANYAQFVDLGFARSRFIGAWGVTEHLGSPKNPRAAYLASLNG